MREKSEHGWRARAQDQSIGSAESQAAGRLVTAQCVGGREECSAYVASVWAWLEGLGTGISRSDPRTWAAPHWPPGHRGIINTLEVAHTDFVWRVRKHARICQARRSYTEAQVRARV